MCLIAFGKLLLLLLLPQPITLGYPNLLVMMICVVGFGDCWLSSRVRERGSSNLARVGTATALQSLLLLLRQVLKRRFPYTGLLKFGSTLRAARKTAVTGVI